MTSAASPAPHGLSLIASWDDGHGSADEERPEGCRQPAVQRAARSRPLVFVTIDTLLASSYSNSLNA
jgi:hypothetical protein